jgi:transposase
MAQNNGNFTAKECQAVMKYLFLKGNSAKRIYDMLVTSGDKCLSYSTVKNWVAWFRTGHLSIEDECSGDNSIKHGGRHSFRFWTIKDCPIKR